jgi:Leu/Phe-tRNA-protein transferase
MKIAFVSLVLILASCSSNDTAICDCLSSGEKLEKFSAEMLTREATTADLSKMKKLKGEQMKKCKEFQTMDGAKMLELKEECQKN